VGRSADNPIHIDDPKASRRHAVIERQAQAYLIRDLDSSNGTFVNDQRITQAVLLRVGDEIRIGNTRLVVADD
jgi:pSer/pThr/pTyr-binding forkhead associated (FHA) protein